MAKHTRKRKQQGRKTRKTRKTQLIRGLENVGSTIYTRTKQSIPAIRSRAIQLKNIAYSRIIPVVENGAKKTLNAIDYGVERGLKLIKNRK
jgi:hypothetical protein